MMKNNKLIFEKFRIAKLSGAENIIGGSDPDHNGGDGTDTDSPKDGKCVLGSKVIVKDEEKNQ